MNINEYFDHIYCVNLDTRSDKWSICMSEFDRHKLIVQRWSAVDGKTLPRHPKLMPGEVGCLKSHEMILRDIIENGYKRVLVLEDDVEFVPNLQHRFADAVSRIPAHWDMLYLGGSHLNKPQPINNSIARISRTYTTSSYGITLELATEILSRFDNVQPHQVDVVYSHLHPIKQCYSFVPALAWQRAGHSDIHNTYVDYTEFMKPKDL